MKAIQERFQNSGSVAIITDLLCLGEQLHQIAPKPDQMQVAVLL